MDTDRKRMRIGDRGKFLSDDVIYARTAKGQRELVSPSLGLDPLERRFLGVVTGHTPLRVLIDLGLQDPGLQDAIIALLDKSLLSVDAKDSAH
jgi:hypothetical protein